jgi:hypothetical protein
MQPFTIFDNPLFWQIWLDLPGFSCKYRPSSIFSCCVDKEYTRVQTKLKKSLER